ncbi:glucan biosynthesis protein [Roseibium salinum]|uniref:Glucan biosynthesis protein n=1 Tax=Roseibium salinum TaxID=1604349 RepID=A0ABT3R983_9HYPH|nr:glucan biosynthesis protein [Roseibium sp. DSM 29163]MCX2725668.1 glucan biosynthesis protein [Roseibium sp. DSM 29163]
MRNHLSLVAMLAAMIVSFQARAGELEAERGEPRPFSFGILTETARRAAARPYQEPEVRASRTLEDIDYDAHWQIGFRKEETVELAPGVPLQFFHLGRFFKEPVTLHEVRDGEAREILYSPDYFDIPDDNPARELPSDIGFAGFRVMRPDLETDWISFLGAAYFRTDGQSRQYGQSARGLAVDTGLSTPEEFPRFTEFWFEPATSEDETLTVYALMDSPSVTGAYRMSMNNEEGEGQVIDVDSHLFFRKPVERLGIAPLTSMYWYSETNRSTGLDWRPEVHDTDGLAIISETGEEIWRPLNNPSQIRVSTFQTDNVKGFGLAQRDRTFANYQDDGVFYDKRPSVWIEPREPFGKGAVQLVELPTDDEIYDNIVAYFLPEDLPQAGEERQFAYRMTWRDRHPLPRSGARVAATRVGQGGVPGQPRPADQIKVVIDFAGKALEGKRAADEIEPVVELSKGEPINAYVLPVVGTSRWRVIFDARVNDDNPIEARVYLKTEKDVLSETWLGQISNQMVARPR